MVSLIPLIACTYRGAADRPQDADLSVKVHARVVSAVGATLTEDAIPSPREAFQNLPNGRSIYAAELGGSSIGRLRQVRKISVPESVHGAPCLAEVLPPGARRCLGGDAKRMLLPPPEREAQVAD
ncbi:unnamed protein product [Prorocentrum cordatum]|uniref:Uncharacterized protein n=1 Tax=Prorocentrum cordatum TaxID=2364126 RepID=A0ABN9XHZ5_9DINO|nr:unnamed protein product [Polarella glacialis]